MKGFIKKKDVPQLGFRTPSMSAGRPDFLKLKNFPTKRTTQKFNASQFRTQHKGG